MKTQRLRINVERKTQERPERNFLDSEIFGSAGQPSQRVETNITSVREELWDYILAKLKKV